MKARKRKRKKKTSTGREYAPCTKPGDRDSSGRFAPGNSNAFRKGETGNTYGRPRQVKLSTAFKQKLATICRDPRYNPEDLDITWAEVIAQAMVEEAAAGVVRASKELREATEGNTHVVKPEWRGILEEMGADPDKAMESLIKEVGNLVSTPK